MSDDAYTMNVKGLDKLLKALKGRQPVARVGVLGTKTHRNAGSSKTQAPTNAEIGAAHEFGAPGRNLPQRSFLRVPIADNLQNYMERSGALDKKVMAEVVAQGSVMPWMKKIAVLAESIVADAFDSAGFGKWAPWQVKGYSNNANQILVDTQQLRNSITSEVKE